MRKLVTLCTVLAFSFMLGFSGMATAQKKHAPKGVWKAMIGSLTDIQGITASLTVFDMERAAEFADSLVKRETFISKIKKLPKPVRDGHAKVAEAATKLAAATKAGEEEAISLNIGKVLAACSSCHYNLRDKKRLEKMK